MAMSPEARRLFEAVERNRMEHEARKRRAQVDPAGIGVWDAGSVPESLEDVAFRRAKQADGMSDRYVTAEDVPAGAEAPRRGPGREVAPGVWKVRVPSDTGEPQPLEQ